jgi:hypothetical protein
LERKAKGSLRRLQAAEEVGEELLVVEEVVQGQAAGAVGSLEHLKGIVPAEDICHRAF